MSRKTHLDARNIWQGRVYKATPISIIISGELAPTVRAGLTAGLFV